MEGVFLLSRFSRAVSFLIGCSSRATSPVVSRCKPTTWAGAAGSGAQVLDTQALRTIFTFAKKKLVFCSDSVIIYL